MADDPGTGSRSSAAAGTVLLASVLALAGAAEAFHRPETETELTASADEVQLSTGEPVVEFEVVYRYPTFVPSAHPTETKLEAATDGPIEAEIEPGIVPHAVDEPGQRGSLAPYQEDVANVTLRLDLSDPGEAGSRMVTMRANTSGSKTLDSSRDQVNLTVRWQVSASSEPETADPEAAAGHASPASAGTPDDGDERTIPAAGSVGSLAALATALAVGRGSTSVKLARRGDEAW